MPTDRSTAESQHTPSQQTGVPSHVAIIMDGNGRWAERRGQPRIEGHGAGTDNIRRVVRCAAEQGITYLTLFAFSTENWNRPNQEVQGLMDILGQVISRETEALHEQGVRINHLGRLDRISPELGKSIARSLELTKNNRGLVLSVAFDYGGRDEVLQAVRQLIADGLRPEEVAEDTFERYLYTARLPDPDLIIRTGGEMRLSNFLLWQSAYSEHYVTDTLWPDFNEGEMAKALSAYQNRQRRFGRLCSTSAP